MIAILVFLTIF